MELNPTGRSRLLGQPYDPVGAATQAGLRPDTFLTGDASCGGSCVPTQTVADPAKRRMLSSEKSCLSRHAHINR